jgi:hypothetical protein
MEINKHYALYHLRVIHCETRLSRKLLNPFGKVVAKVPSHTNFGGEIHF